MSAGSDLIQIEAARKVSHALHARVGICRLAAVGRIPWRPRGPDTGVHSVADPHRVRLGDRSNGASVLDHRIHFAVKEGGKVREVLQAGPATRPMKIAIVIDDNGTGIFRYGVGRFIQRAARAGGVRADAAGQFLKILDYTANGQELAMPSPSWWRGRERPTAGNCSRVSTRPPGTSSGARPTAR